jgi:hypothetical protein
MTEFLKTIGALALLSIAAGCDHAETKKADGLSTKNAPFHESAFTDITPTADGGAYAVGVESGVWYLRGKEAIKVEFSPLPTGEAITFLAALTITPLVGGGAYATSPTEKAVWYLREGTARKVTEASALTSKPISSHVSAFPLYVAERRKRLEAEKSVQEHVEADEGRDE